MTRDSPDERRTILREVVRGERDWRELAGLGLEPQRDERGWVLPVDDVDVLVVQAGDHATGLRHYLSQPPTMVALDRTMARAWALYLIGSDLFDFSGIAESADAAIYEVLWDLSGGDPEATAQRVGMST